MDNSDVKTVKQASEAVAESVPEKVTLSGGDTVTVKKLGWKDFRKMFESISGIVQRYIEYQQASEKSSETAMAHAYMSAESGNTLDAGEVEKAEAKAAHAFSELAARIVEAPEVVELLVEKTTGYSPEKQADLDFDDVLELANAALQLNFIKNKKVLGFFGAWTSAIGGSQKASASPESE